MGDGRGRADLRDSDAEGRSKEFGWKCDVVTLGSEGDGCLHHFLYVMQKEGEWNE